MEMVLTIMLTIKVLSLPHFRCPLAWHLGNEYGLAILRSFGLITADLCQILASVCQVDGKVEKAL